MKGATSEKIRVIEGKFKKVDTNTPIWFKCTQCGKCCTKQTGDLGLTPADIYMLSKEFGVEMSEVVSRYAKYESKLNMPLC